jgi:WhiB family redox-sensing transcriptional regulator
MNELFDATDFALTVPITEERPWAVFAACRDRDPDVFFPATVEQEREAVMICNGCAVNLDCLEFALETKVSFGIWGGLTEKQRKALGRRSA